MHKKNKQFSIKLFKLIHKIKWGEIMDKKLPKIFANKINEKAGNNETIYYSDKQEKETKQKNNYNYKKNINQKINEIFNSNNYIYKADVKIKLKNETIKKRIVGHNTTHLITIDNELIPITDIIDIEKTN